MRVRIGLCGFTMAMEDYALHFPVVEVQNTFYEWATCFAVSNPAPPYVLFNNMPRVGDAKRFAKLVGE